MGQLQVTDPTQWTIKDTVREIWDKSKGPLEILIAAGFGVALYKVTGSEGVDTFLKYSTRTLGAVALASLVTEGIRDIRFYRSLYRAVHQTVEEHRQEISE